MPLCLLYVLYLQVVKTVFDLFHVLKHSKKGSSYEPAFLYEATEKTFQTNETSMYESFFIVSLVEHVSFVD